MVSPPSNPHDAYFRCVMGRPVDAASEIRVALPATITARLNLTTSSTPTSPQFSFLLDDVAALDLAALRARDLTPATRVMLVLHKIAPGSSQLGDDMLELIEDLQAMKADPNVDLRPTFSYILIVGDTPEEDLDPVIEQLGPRAKEAIVTTAERLRAEGEARGEARGKARGRAEGRAETLIEQLTEKFGAVPAALVARVRAADVDRSREWTRRVLTANTLDETFA